MANLSPAPPTPEGASVPWGLREVVWGLLLAALLVVAVLLLPLALALVLHLPQGSLRGSNLAGVFVVLGEAVLVVPVWVFALRTLSQSEEGFDIIHQGYCLCEKSL